MRAFGLIVAVWFCGALGACADAPVMLVNDRQMLSFMGDERLDELVALLRAEAARRAKQG